jgi:hypothetical protein
MGAVYRTGVTVAQPTGTTNTPLDLNFQEADDVIANGICVPLNAPNGWVLWGSRTSCFPQIRDPKSTWITSRRMLSYYQNRFVLTWWNLLHTPGNRQFVQSILNGESKWIASRVSEGSLLGGEISFPQTLNPDYQLVDGIFGFHTALGLVMPGERIDVDVEVDTRWLSTLFGG